MEDGDRSESSRRAARGRPEFQMRGHRGGSRMSAWIITIIAASVIAGGGAWAFVTYKQRTDLAKTSFAAGNQCLERNPEAFDEALRHLTLAVENAPASDLDQYVVKRNEIKMRKDAFDECMASARKSLGEAGGLMEGGKPIEARKVLSLVKRVPASLKPEFDAAVSRSEALFESQRLKIELADQRKSDARAPVAVAPEEEAVAIQKEADGASETAEGEEKPETRRVVLNGDTPLIPSGAERAEKPDFEADLERSYEKCVQRLKYPVIGRTYRVPLRSGGVAEGLLKSFENGKIVIELAKGVVGIPIHNVDPSAYTTLFPQRIARIAAMELMSARIRSAGSKSAGVANKAAGAAISEEEAVKASKEIVGQMVKSRAEIKYAPSAKDETDALSAPAQVFTNWMKFQESAMGLRFTEGMRAFQDKGHSILFVRVGSSFEKLGYERRFTVVESMVAFWAMRCLDAGSVDTAANAHVVLLNTAGIVVGGSTERSGLDIWVKGGQMAMASPDGKRRVN